MQRECAETEAFLVGLVQGNPLSDLLISKRYIPSNTQEKWNVTLVILAGYVEICHSSCRESVG
jgi:hypothetical protein